MTTIIKEKCPGCAQYPTMYMLTYSSYSFICDTNGCGNKYETTMCMFMTSAIKDWNGQMQWIKSLMESAYSDGCDDGNYYDRSDFDV